MPIHRLNHAVLYVRDAEVTASFYEGVLGFERLPMGFPGAAFMRAPGSTNDHDLGLFSVGSSAQPSTAGRGSVGLYHLAWEVSTLEDLEDLSGSSARPVRSSVRATMARPRAFTAKIPTASSSSWPGSSRRTSSMRQPLRAVRRSAGLTSNERRAVMGRQPSGASASRVDRTRLGQSGRGGESPETGQVAKHREGDENDGDRPGERPPFWYRDAPATARLAEPCEPRPTDERNDDWEQGVGVQHEPQISVGGRPGRPGRSAEGAP